jgi:chorismate mutase/prephenate dehydratase
MGRTEIMAKSTPRKKATPSPRPPSAHDSAARLAAIDAEMLTLVQERAALVAEAAAGPAEAAAVLDAEPARLAALVEAGGGPLPPRTVRAIFREIQSGCRALVHQPRIAFLGPLYSYSHLAAIHRFGRSVQLVPVGTISAVFEEVHQGHADFGLVPVENSTDGRIADTLAMFTRLPVRICGQVEMYIHHSLLAKCSRAEVKEVYSRPQAISQCRNWLAKHLPAARTIEVTSTSTAAQLAAEKPGAAAIASPQAGVEYALAVLAENIEDNPENTTRFAVIGGQVPARTGNDRTAMLFQVAHRPGALAEAMNIFKRNKLNLTWIESFPIPGTARGFYLFFVEMEGHQSDARLRRAVAALKRKSLRLEILGSFPATVAVE